VGGEKFLKGELSCNYLKIGNHEKWESGKTKK
jgi:hypothetical protein